jgi:hypothetical protein
MRHSRVVRASALLAILLLAYGAAGAAHADARCVHRVHVGEAIVKSGARHASPEIVLCLAQPAHDRRA